MINYMPNIARIMAVIAPAMYGHQEPLGEKKTESMNRATKSLTMQ